ncbi:MAG TPA: multiheme c-type cytochrome, partial [Candidatus Acidoferrales bacterium]|nr:multiheme c-type cytochrome [Candidatus Acidoferrales bacterium]
MKDKHSRAFTALSNPVAVRMARILGLARADAAPKCLACHALDVPANERGRTFDLSDGVSCESCHGPASAWLGPHTAKDWTHEQ